MLAVFAATAAARPIIGNVTGTPNTSFANTGGGGAAKSYDATVGFWSRLPGSAAVRPAATTCLAAPIRINGNGGFTLDYQIRTQDILLLNWLSIYLDTPTGTTTLVREVQPEPEPVLALRESCQRAHHRRESLERCGTDAQDRRPPRLRCRSVPGPDHGPAHGQQQRREAEGAGQEEAERPREAIAPRKPPRSAPDRGRARAKR